MKLILHHTYDRSGGMSALENLRWLSLSGADALICRVRRSRDNVLLIHEDTTMARLCLCEERIDELRFCEIDALMRLGGYRVLTLDELLDGYRERTPLILHFRSFRPSATVISRFIGDERFSFATDSVEQLRAFTEGFPGRRTVGFSCHLPNADAMQKAGADAVCLYGRTLGEYDPAAVRALGQAGEIWLEPDGDPIPDLDTVYAEAQRLSASGAVLRPDAIR